MSCCIKKSFKEWIVGVSILGAFSAPIDPMWGDEVKSDKWTPLVGHIDVYVDEGGGVTYEEVESIEKSKWRPGGEAPQYYWFKERVWVKLETQSLSIGDTQYIIFTHPLTHTVKMYYRDEEGVDREVESGHSELKNYEVFNNKNIIFPAPQIDPGSPIYFEIYNPDQPWELNFVLSDVEGLVAYSGQREAFHWAYFAIILTLIFYNLMIFLSTRDWSYIYYIAFHVFFALTILFLQGYGLIYLMKGNYEIAFHVFSGVIVAAAFMGIIFSYKVMDIGKNMSAGWVRAVYLCLWGVPLSLLLYPASSFLFVSLFNIILFAAIVIVFAAGVLLAGKYAVARNFIIAWSPFFVFLILYTLNSVHIHIPAVEAYGLEIGSALEAILLSNVLALRLKSLNQAAQRDSLTGVFNRRAFYQELKKTERELSQAKNGMQAYLIVLDLDNFKLINDKFGHACGDDVLIQLANLVQESIRPEDFFARWGGEEFVMVVKKISLDGAAAMAEKIRLHIETSSFGCIEQLTASFGIAPIEAGVRKRDTFHRADQALYLAKSEGKNRIKIYQG